MVTTLQPGNRRNPGYYRRDAFLFFFNTVNSGFSFFSVSLLWLVGDISSGMKWPKTEADL